MRDRGPLSTLSREGFMHRARLLAPVLLFVAGCGDGGSQTPTSPLAPPTNRAPTVSGAIPEPSIKREQIDSLHELGFRKENVRSGLSSPIWSW